MCKKSTALKIIPRRFLNLSGKFLKAIEDEEIKIYKKLNSKDKRTLDPINKKKLDYPEDIYPIKDAPLEWWYFTGHLEDKKQKKKLGYEFCFFKFHPQPIRFGPIPFSILRRKPFLVSHFAITDKNNKTFKSLQDSGIFHKEEINYDKLDLKLNHSSMRLEKKKNFHLQTKNKLAEMELSLKPLKKLVKHFDHGFSVMIPNTEHRTYYLTFPRLRTSGKIKLGKKKYSVSGLSWFDHQKMTVSHKSPLQGWDWFGVMLDDGTEVMVYVLRTKKDKKYLGGTYIDKNSKIKNLLPKDLRVKRVSSWKSPNTGNIYPSGWRLEVPKLKLSLIIKSSVRDQEIYKFRSAPVSYWEGACEVEGKRNGKKISGQGYVELVGYDKRLRWKLIKSWFE